MFRHKINISPTNSWMKRKKEKGTLEVAKLGHCHAMTSPTLHNEANLGADPRPGPFSRANHGRAYNDVKLQNRLSQGEAEDLLARLVNEGSISININRIELATGKRAKKTKTI
jgi:hypothetical protein